MSTYVQLFILTGASGDSFRELFQTSLLLSNMCYSHFSIMSTKESPFKYSKLSRGQIRLLKPESDDLSGFKWELESVQLLNSDGDDNVGSPCDYDALSYVWGEPGEGEFHITCNGKTLKVSENLYRALPFLARQLKQEGSSPRRIWIDAVCINQLNEAEKPKQIDRMPTIYRHARQVIVWFGPGCGKDDNDAAIALLPLLNQIGTATVNYFMDSHQPRPDFSGTEVPDASSPVWQVLGDIIFSKWYTRLWIVQEFVLAQSTVALIGDSTIDFDTLENSIGLVMSIVMGRAIKLLPGVTALQEEGIKRKVDFSRLMNRITLVTVRGSFDWTPGMDTQQRSPLQESSATTTAPRRSWRWLRGGLVDHYKGWKASSSWRWFTQIRDVLSSTSPSRTFVFQNADQLLTGIFLTVLSQECKDPRGYVFGVLGFSGNDDTKALGLKYKRDLAELYTLFMGYVFESGKRIVLESPRRFLWEVFGYACLPNKILRLPSWCPDLQMQRRPGMPLPISLLRRKRVAVENTDSFMGVQICDHLYKADDGEIDMRIGESEKVLVLKGTVFDRLEEVFPAFPEQDPQLRFLEQGNWERLTNMYASIGQWEKQISTMVLGSQEVGTGHQGVISLDTYWRTLVGNDTALSEGDSEFTCETLYALRDFDVRDWRIKMGLDELKQR